ncbi:MAG TPA: ATP-binding protein [Cyclobacteriaceae bacterium]|nr:ATP-binding protein [Cyclobacteriaceae bacterium]
MRYIYFIVGFISFITLQAQSIEQMEQQLREKMHDTARLNLLINLGSRSLYADNKKARIYSNEALELAEKIEENKFLVKSFVLASNLAIAEGNFSNALKYDNRALQLSLVAKDSIQISQLLNRIGFNYAELGYFDEAYDYLVRAFRVSRDAAKSKADSLNLSIPLHNLGRLFKELEQYERAIEYLNLAQKISDLINDEEGIAYTLDEVGDVYMRQEKYSEAMDNFTQALQHSKRLNIDFLKPRLYNRLAELYTKTGTFDKALIYYDSALHLQNLSNNIYGLAEIEYGLSLVNLARNNNKEAEQLLLSSLSKANELNARVLEMKILIELSQLKENKGDYKSALDYYKKHEILEDELFSLEMQNKLSQGQVRFATESKDFLIEELSRKEAEQEAMLKREEFIRNILVVIVALFGVLIFNLYMSGKRRRKMNTLLLKQQKEIEERTIELQELNKVKDKFFSIISHDLRSPINALAGILDLIEKGHMSELEIKLLTKELRIQFNHTKTLINNLLDWALLQMDKLSIQPLKVKLKELVDQNFKLLDALQTKNISMENNIPDDFNAYADPNTINLVFRNLIMNALKFTEDGGKIIVSAERKGDEVLVSISDNGIGMSKEIQEKLFDKKSPYSTRGTANEKGTGLGLMLCKEFVERNGGKIWVESEEGKGSIFKFTLKSSLTA